jgi:Family of unknown function (DUF6489)
MKVTIDIDCTPDEARVFLGLPDVQPMQQALLQQMQERLAANIQAMDGDAMMRLWLPAGLQGFEQWQKMVWSQMTQAMSGTTKEKR